MKINREPNLQGFKSYKVIIDVETEQDQQFLRDLASFDMTIPEVFHNHGISQDDRRCYNFLKQLQTAVAKQKG
jgi:phosphopantetheinyl transferase